MENSAQRLKETFKSNFLKLIPALDHFMEIPRKKIKGEKIHKMRVISRRLRAALTLLKDKEELKKIEGSIKRLRKLEKGMSLERGLLVAQKDAQIFHLKPQKLTKLLAKARVDTYRSLKKDSRQKILKRVNKLPQKIFTSSHFHLNFPVTTFEKEMTFWLKQNEIPNSRIHEFRKTLREVRFAFEALGLSLISTKKLLEDLGRWHDFEVLQDFLGTKSRIRREQEILRKKINKRKNSTLKLVLKELRNIQSARLELN